MPPYPQQPQQPVYPQPGYGQPIAPPRPVAAKSPLPSRIPWLNVGIGCLLLLVGFLLGIATFLLFQTATSGNPTSTPTTAAAAPSAPAPGAATAVPPRPDRGTEAPNATLKNLDDQNQDLSAVIANKYAVIVFWTTDAKNDDAMALLQKTATDKADKFVAVAINPKENRSTVKDYSQQKSLGKITMLLDDGAAKNAYGVTTLPTYFLVGKDGNITERLEGTAISKQDLESKINALLK
jgi:thiol-disulfide isomerase/thioredoxin